ncbi:MAG: FUSC family protein [Clostridiales bacterium]|nr:FUSC family protein [Clostridiales bacterium]
MNGFNFFESDIRPTLHVGKRIIKTVIAVFLCALIGYLRKTDSAILSMVAAIICIQPTRDESLMFAFNRVIGTVLGGALGALCLFLARITGLINISTLYHLVIAIMLIPIIQLTLWMRKPSLSSFTCIVFLMVTVTLVEGASPVLYALKRTFETLIGIAVGLGVNWIFPKSKKERELEALAKTAEEPEAPADPNELDDSVDGTDSDEVKTGEG